MKIKFFLSIEFIFLFVISCAHTQKTGSNLNLSFENVQDGKPVGWYVYLQKNYSVSLDSVTVKSGKYSIAIEYVGYSAYFQSITLALPKNYDGKKHYFIGIH